MTKGRAAAAFGGHGLRKTETKNHKKQAGSRPHKKETSKGVLQSRDSREALELPGCEQKKLVTLASEKHQRRKANYFGR